MNQGILRAVVLSILLFGHIFVFVGSFYFVTEIDKSLLIAGTLLPVSSALITTMVQFIAQNMRGAPSDRDPVSVTFFLVLVILSVSLIASLFFLLYKYSIGAIINIGTLQTAVALVDTFIAIYVTILIRELFHNR